MQPVFGQFSLSLVVLTDSVSLVCPRTHCPIPSSRAFLPQGGVFCFVAIKKLNSSSQYLLVKHLSFRPQTHTLTHAGSLERSFGSGCQSCAANGRITSEPTDRPSRSPAPVCLIRSTVPLVQIPITIHSHWRKNETPLVRHRAGLLTQHLCPIGGDDRRSPPGLLLSCSPPGSHAT